MNWKRILILVGVLVLAIILYRCDKKKKEDITSEKLKEGEQTAVIINPSTGETTVIRKQNPGGTQLCSPILRGGKSESSTVSGETIERITGGRDTRISIGPDGKVTVTIRTKGFCFDVGPIGGITTSPILVMGLDVQWAFYKNWGLNSGLVIDKSLRYPRLYIGGSYKIVNRFVHNTSIVVGIDSRKELITGIKLNF